MTNSVNMNLPIPVPSTTPGPTYAQNEVTCFGLIDTHSHVSGQGVQVPVAGLNINADLPLNSNNINSARGLRLVSLGTLPALPLDLRMVYSYNGELYYQDASGNNVQMTNAGSVAGATGTITGLTSPATASFASGRFTFNKDSSKPGKLSISDINLYEFNNAAANAITIKSPASLASAYTLTLPAALPSQTAVVSMNSSGQLTTGLVDGTVGAPSLAFASDLATGIYKDVNASSRIGFASGGVEAASLDAGALVMLNGATVVTSAGTVTGPGYQFFGEQTGIYKSATGEVSVTCSGTKQASFASTNLTVVGGVAAGASSTALKWKVVTNSLSAGSVDNVTISGTIVGVTGYTQLNATSNWATMPTVLSGETVGALIYLQTIQGTTNTVYIANGDNVHTNNYKLVIFYI